MLKIVFLLGQCHMWPSVTTVQESFHTKINLVICQYWKTLCINNMCDVTGSWNELIIVCASQNCCPFYKIGSNVNNIVSDVCHSLFGRRHLQHLKKLYTDDLIIMHPSHCTTCMVSSNLCVNWEACVLQCVVLQISSPKVIGWCGGWSGLFFVAETCFPPLFQIRKLPVTCREWHPGT